MSDSYILSRRAAWPTTASGRPVFDTDQLTAVARRVHGLSPEDAWDALNQYFGLDESDYADEDGDNRLRSELFDELSGTLHALAGQISRAELRLEFDGRRWWLEVHDLHHESGDYSELLRSVDLVDDCAVTAAPVDGPVFVDVTMTAAAMVAADTVVQVALAALRSTGATPEQLAEATTALTKVADAPVQLAATMRGAYETAHHAWLAQGQNPTAAQAS